MTTEKKIWFRAKRYGWGWGMPTCWQGWAVLIVYGALLAGGVHFFLEHQNGPYFAAYVGVISAGLVAICWFKGEPPRWRWGRD
jgi:hypothetical protein